MVLGLSRSDSPCWGLAVEMWAPKCQFVSGPLRCCSGGCVRTEGRIADSHIARTAPTRYITPHRITCQTPSEASDIGRSDALHDLGDHGRRGDCRRSRYERRHTEPDLTDCAGDAARRAANEAGITEWVSDRLPGLPVGPRTSGPMLPRSSRTCPRV